MLDVAIGLIFVYLLLSIICTAANEWLSKETSSGQAVKPGGAWRLRFEHLSKEAQVQAVFIPENTNPDHIFEVHPVTSFNGIDVLERHAPPQTAGRFCRRASRSVARKAVGSKKNRACVSGFVAASRIYRWKEKNHE